MIKRRDRNHSKNYPNPDYLAIFALLLNFFFILFVYVLLETIIVPMTKDLYAWSSEFAIKIVGIGLSVIGVLAFIMFFVCTILCKYIDERKVYMCFGLIPLIIAMFIHLPMGPNYPLMQDCSNYSISTTIDPAFTTLIPRDDNNVNHAIVTRDARYEYASSAEDYFRHYLVSVTRSKRSVGVDIDGGCDALGCPTSQTWCYTTPIIELPQLILANLFGVVGYPIAFTISSSLFSKMISPANQGFWMGLLTSTGSLSRMSGPIFVTWVYANYGTRWTFGALAVILICTLIISVILFKRLIPMDINKNNPSVDNNVP